MRKFPRANRLFLKTNIKAPGVTITQILLSVGLVGSLSSVGIASLISYTRATDLNNAAADLASTLNSARSRAQSQIKPTDAACSNAPLEGYQVVICKDSCRQSDEHYELQAVCGGTPIQMGETKRLSDNNHFSNDTETTFFFPVLHGTSTEATSISITNGSDSIGVGVDDSGNIHLTDITSDAGPTPIVTPTHR